MTLTVLLLMANQDALSTTNLQYAMWKSGLRRYDQDMVLAALQHDNYYRASLLGIDQKDFDQRFPYTFYEMKTIPEVTPPNQTRLINSYAQSLRPEDGCDGWVAIFENDRLIDFTYHKGT